MRIFHANAAVRSDSTPDPAWSLTLTMEHRSYDELSRLWQATTVPLRLGAVYRAASFPHARRARRGGQGSADRGGHRQRLRCRHGDATVSTVASRTSHRAGLARRGAPPGAAARALVPRAVGAATATSTRTASRSPTARSSWCCCRARSCGRRARSSWRADEQARRLTAELDASPGQGRALGGAVLGARALEPRAGAARPRAGRRALPGAAARLRLHPGRGTRLSTRRPALVADLWGYAAPPRLRRRARRSLRWALAHPVDDGPRTALELDGLGRRPAACSTTCSPRGSERARPARRAGRLARRAPAPPAGARRDRALRRGRCRRRTAAPARDRARRARRVGADDARRAGRGQARPRGCVAVDCAQRSPSSPTPAPAAAREPGRAARPARSLVWRARRASARARCATPCARRAALVLHRRDAACRPPAAATRHPRAPTRCAPLDAGRAAAPVVGRSRRTRRPSPSPSGRCARREIETLAHGRARRATTRCSDVCRRLLLEAAARAARSAGAAVHVGRPGRRAAARGAPARVRGSGARARRGARRLGARPPDAARPRCDGAVRRAERNRQDDGRAGAGPRRSGSSSTASTSRAWSTSTSARPRSTCARCSPPASARR